MFFSLYLQNAKGSVYVCRRGNGEFSEAGEAELVRWGLITSMELSVPVLSSPLYNKGAPWTVVWNVTGNGGEKPQPIQVGGVCRSNSAQLWVLTSAVKVRACSRRLEDFPGPGENWRLRAEVPSHWRRVSLTPRSLGTREVNACTSQRPCIFISLGTRSPYNVDDFVWFGLSFRHLNFNSIFRKNFLQRLYGWLHKEYLLPIGSSEMRFRTFFWKTDAEKSSGD